MYECSRSSNSLNLLQLNSHPLNLAVNVRLHRMLPRRDGSPTFGRGHPARETALAEEKRDILQFQAFRLRIEEVHHGDKCRVEHSKDDECAPANVFYFVSAGCSWKERVLKHIRNASGVIFTTAKTAIQFQPDAIACIRVLVRVVDISLG